MTTMLAFHRHTHEEAIRQSLRDALSAEQVEACESQALGHTDYAAKWAYALAEAVSRQPKSKNS